MLVARVGPKWGMEVEAQRLWHQSPSRAWREVGDASGGDSSPVLVQSLPLWEQIQPDRDEVSCFLHRETQHCWHPRQQCHEQEFPPEMAFPGCET